jgi:hypothetical protein
MDYKIMYVELKSGYAHNGPAWIGKVFFSRTGKTAYFNGMAFKRTRGVSTEIKTGRYYWITGAKKNGDDRHWAGTNKRRDKIIVDKDAVEEYLTIRGLRELPQNIYEIGELNNVPPIEETTKIENAAYNDKEPRLFQSDWYANKRKQV